MKPLVEQVKAEYSGKIAFDDYSLDNPENSAIADKYSIPAIPAFVFIGKDGQVANKVIGITSKEALTQNIDQILK